MIAALVRVMSFARTKTVTAWFSPLLVPVMAAVTENCGQLSARHEDGEGVPLAGLSLVYH